MARTISIFDRASHRPVTPETSPWVGRLVRFHSPADPLDLWEVRAAYADPNSWTRFTLRRYGGRPEGEFRERVSIWDVELA